MAMTTQSRVWRSSDTPSIVHRSISWFLSLRRLLTILSLGWLLTACSSPQERAFMRACTSGGSNGADDACQCAYDKLEAHYPQGTLDHLTDPSQLPPDFEDAVMNAGLQCRAEL